MTKTLMIGAAALAMTAFGATAANATATYSAEAITTLTLVSVTNTTNADNGDGELEFAIATSLDEEGSDTDGDATAMTDFLFEPTGDGLVQNSLGVGTSLTNQGSVTGTATDGTSSAFVSTTGDLVIDNLSFTDTFEVTFELSFDLFATASVDGDGESANAGAFATVESELFGGATGTVTQGGISTALSETVLALALEPTGADGTLSDAGTLLITFVVVPGAAVEMFMFADVLGNAMGMADLDMDADVVPLPGALGFMAFGAAGLAGLKRRKARAA